MGTPTGTPSGLAGTSRKVFLGSSSPAEIAPGGLLQRPLTGGTPLAGRGTSPGGALVGNKSRSLSATAPAGFGLQSPAARGGGSSGSRACPAGPRSNNGQRHAAAALEDPAANELEHLLALVREPVLEEDPVAKRLLEGDSLYEVLASGAVSLLKGSWLVDFAEGVEGERPLPRRQDLPAESFWQPDDLFALTRSGQRELRSGHEIIAFSHCWLSAEHPDPHRSQVEKLGRFVKGWANKQSGLLTTRVAVYIDWCSLMQEPRTAAETALFARGQEQAMLWFCHKLVHVMLLTQTPRGVNPYLARGWTFFESAVGVIKAHWGGNVFDMGRCESGARHIERGWPNTSIAMSVLVELNNSSLDSATFQMSSPPRRPPLTPKKFAQILETKILAERSDIETLVRQYTDTFHAFANSMVVLDYSGLDWGDHDAEMVADALPSFTRLKELNMSHNELTEMGAGLLAAEIPECKALAKLYLTNNEIMEGLEGSEALSRAWKEAKKDPFHLFMSYPEMSDYVKQKLRE